MSGPRLISSLSTFAFEAGQCFVRGETSFVVVEQRGAQLILEHAQTLERKAVSVHNLAAEYAAGRLVPSQSSEIKAPTLPANDVLNSPPARELPLDMLTAAQRAHVLSLFEIIHLLRGRGFPCLRPTGLLELEYRRLREERPSLAPVALQTVYNWSLKLDRAGGDARALIPGFSMRGGKGRARTHPDFQKAFESVVEVVRNDKSRRISAASIERDVRTRLLHDLGPDRTLEVMGSRATISRRLHQVFSAFDICQRNKGRAAALREFRSWYPRDRAISPLEVVEFDDKDTGVFLIDELTGLPHGRGYITVGVDQYSGVPMGSNISPEPRSTWSAICTLTAAVLPKDKTSPDFALVSSAVDVFGRPSVALFDNALYNHAGALEAAVLELGITPAWSKPRTPTEKSCVEGYNGRLGSDFLPQFAGYRGSKATRDGLTEGLAKANASAQDFLQRYNKWAYDQYIHNPADDGITPYQKWSEGIRAFAPRLPVDVHRLRIVPTLRGRVRLRPEGVRFAGLIYQHELLQILRRKVGATAEIEYRFDPRNLSLIYVFDAEAKQLFEVPSANPDYTGALTLYQHRLIRKIAREHHRTNPSIPQMLVAREDLRRLVTQLRQSPKRSERRRAVRVGEVVGDQVTITPRPQKAEMFIVGELEAKLIDIDQVEIEPLGDGWELPSFQ